MLRNIAFGAAFVVFAVGSTGCSQLGVAAGSADCTGSAATDVTLGIVRDQIVKLASERDGDAPALSKSKIRATIRDLKISLEDIRTTKKDPNSTKRFCTGSLKIVAPAQLVQDADDARQMASLPSVEAAADNANIEKDANAFKAELNFNVQPTDEGDKVFSEIEDGDEAFRFFGELVQAHLLKSVVADAKAEQDRVQAEKNAEIDSANREMEEATLAEARANNAAAVQQIGAVWKAIPKPARDQMLPAQRAWIRKTEASCKLEAVGQEATTTSQIEAARLACETRAQQARTEELKQYATEAINTEYSDE